MPDEPIIRDKAREAIRSGRVPTVQPSRMFCCRGAGAMCAVCGYPVARGEMEFEFEYRTGPQPEFEERFNWTPEIQRYHLHRHCFMAWDFERTNVGPPERGPSI